MQMQTLEEEAEARTAARYSSLLQEVQRLGAAADAALGATPSKLTALAAVVRAGTDASQRLAGAPDYELRERMAHPGGLHAELQQQQQRGGDEAEGAGAGLPAGPAEFVVPSTGQLYAPE